MVYHRFSSLFEVFKADYISFCSLLYYHLIYSQNWTKRLGGRWCELRPSKQGWGTYGNCIILENAYTYKVFRRMLCSRFSMYLFQKRERHRISATNPLPLATKLKWFVTLNKLEIEQSKKITEERILVGCVTPACKPYVLQWPPPDFALWLRGGESTSFNKCRVLATRCH